MTDISVENGEYHHKTKNNKAREGLYKTEWIGDGCDRKRDRNR